MERSTAIVIFDGECTLCDRSVKWIIARDRAARLRFAARQSPAGQQLLARHGLPPGGVESMILIEGSRVSTHSTAVLRVAGMLSWPWKLASVGLIVPRAVRDFFYRAFARRRYQLAGTQEACPIFTAEQQARLVRQVSEVPTN